MGKIFATIFAAAGISICIYGCGSLSGLFAPPPEPAAKSISAIDRAKLGLPGITIDPETHEEIPNSAAAFDGGRDAAKQDLITSTKRITTWVCTIFALGALAMFALSFFFPWASVKTAAYCAAGVGITLVARYVLVAYGAITGDILFWSLIVTTVGVAGLVGLPALLAYIRRIDWNRGKALALEDGPAKTREGVAIMAAASDKVNKVRSDVVDWINSAQGSDPEAKAKAIESLAKIGIKL